MEEIVKHINDTNASYRSIGAGDAKNTDLFLDNEHYELFKDCGGQVTIRFDKENLSKAILFIASILPRKYDCSSMHMVINYSSNFVLEQLAILDAFFTVDGKSVSKRTQVWNARKDVEQKNGKIDNRFYFNGLITEVPYQFNDEHKSYKFTIRNYVAGGFSDIHIKKSEDGIFDLFVTNTTTPKNDSTELKFEILEPRLATPTNYDKYLRALRTKPFMLLAGISGTGKSRIVRELAFKSCPEYLRDADGTTPGNYLMVEVKPNWHDSSELLGYYSHLANNGNGGYVFTPFTKFLVKAMMFPNVPFFVCLDEMNLAPVEQYFAEFLSVLETRKHDKDNYIQTGVLVKPEYFQGISDHVGDGYICTEFFPDGLPKIDYPVYTNTILTNKGLSLPDNVFVIGTVNMDDTTHQFSRKVIDRAMTIEMNGGKLTEMFGHSADLEYLPADQVWELEKFLPQYVNADEVVAAHPEYEWLIQTQLPAILEDINDVLRDTPFQVSYRVLNEMVIYFSVLVESGMPSEEAKNLAVDQMLLMKILPRIEGDRDMLMLDAQTCRLDKLEPFAASEDTKKKIAEMKNRLNKQEFTRFWP